MLLTAEFEELREQMLAAGVWKFRGAVLEITSCGA
jgi:hypothetical protein